MSIVRKLQQTKEVNMKFKLSKKTQFASNWSMDCHPKTPDISTAGTLNKFKDYVECWTYDANRLHAHGALFIKVGGEWHSLRRSLLETFQEEGIPEYIDI